MATVTARVTSLGRDAARASAADGARRPERLSRAGWVAVLAPGVAMLLLGLVGLDRHSMWRDEAATLVAARRSLPDLVAMLAHVDSVHAVYYTALHAWLGLDPGAGVVWARVPSVLAAAVTTALVALVGARLASLRVGVVAGLLMVVNPTVSYYAQEARSTAFVGAVSLLATLVLLRALRRPRWWVAYGAACLLLVGLNLLAALVPLAHALTLLWWRRSRRDLLRWGPAVAPAAFLVAGLGVLTAPQQLLIGWIPAPGAGSLKELAHLLLGGGAPVLVVAGALVLLGALPGARRLGARSLRALLVPPADALRAVALPLLVLPPLALLLVSLAQPVFVPRYVFPSVAGAALLGAVGIERVGRLVATVVRRPGTTRVAAATAAVVLVALAVGDLGAQRFERTPQSRADDLAGAAAVVAAGRQPGDVVLFLPDNRRLVAEVYPDAFAGVRDVALAENPEQAANLTGRPFPADRVLADLGPATRVWVVGRPSLRLTPTESGSQTLLAALRRDFTPVGTPQAHGMGITLFERRVPAR